jgi:hypothetical protein
MPKQIRKPADPGSGPVAEFGFELRQLRQTAGKSYTTIAKNTYYSKSAMHGVDQGHQLPSKGLLEKFVAECGGEPVQWLVRREQILQHIEATKQVPRKETPRALDMPAPDPTEATTPAEYNDALKRLREWSGHTFRDIEDITSEEGYPLRRAPASTLCNAFQRGTLPTRDLVKSFLRAVEVSDDAQDMWLEVWQALHEGRPVRPTPTWVRWRTDSQRPVAQPPQEPVEPPVAPRVPYTTPDQIRDWVLVDGQWRSTDERADSEGVMQVIVRTLQQRLALLRYGASADFYYWVQLVSASILALVGLASAIALVLLTILGGPDV